MYKVTVVSRLRQWVVYLDDFTLVADPPTHGFFSVDGFVSLSSDETIHLRIPAEDVMWIEGFSIKQE